MTATKKVSELEDIKTILNSGNLEYIVKEVGPHTYEATCGTLSMNILCGCCAQYYDYRIEIRDGTQVQITSTVPCGGWWGGAIGASKTRRETERLQKELTSAFESA